MSDKYKAGLDDSDELGQFPSAASPLASMGVDADQVRANPELLAGLDVRNKQDAGVPLPGLLMRPQVSAPSASSSMAGKLGGAGGAPVPSDSDAQATTALQENLKMGTDTAKAVPISNPDVDRLTAEHNKLSLPAPLYDPQTGKMLAQDKPSLGQKVWRGVRGGLVGLATGGIPGAIVGAVEPGDIAGGKAYGAPNTQYTRGEQRREQQLASTDSALANAQANWKSVVDAAKAKGGLVKDNATTASDILTGSARLQKAVTDQFKAEATADNYKEKADEADNKLQEQMQEKLRTAQDNETRLGIMRDAAAMRDQLLHAQLDLAREKLGTSTDAKTIDQWQKEQIDSINKDYNGVFSSVFNRITAGSKQQRIADVNRAADDRRAALGLRTGTTVPRTATPKYPPGATHIVPGRDGKDHFTNATGTVDLGLVP